MTSSHSIIWVIFMWFAIRLLSIPSIWFACLFPHLTFCCADAQVYFNFYIFAIVFVCPFRWCMYIFSECRQKRSILGGRKTTDPMVCRRKKQHRIKWNAILLIWLLMRCVSLAESGHGNGFYETFYSNFIFGNFFIRNLAWRPFDRFHCALFLLHFFSALENAHSLHFEREFV